MLGKLAASAAHDLNNLLTIIQIHAANVEDASSSGADCVEAGRQIGLTCRRGADLVRRILVFSKGSDDLFEDVVLDSLLADVVALVEPLVRTSRKLELEIIGVPGITIHGNAGGIGQIFLNLLINAAEAPGQGGTVTLRCERLQSNAPESAEIGHGVCVSVLDQSGGIPSEVMANIFDPGFTTKSGGTGMGLAIVSDWVTKHHGKISVQPTAGKGTEIRVCFPLPHSPDGVGEAAPQLEKHLLAPLVLVVEDDDLIRSFGAQILIRADFRVLEAASAEEALAHWKNHRDEIALLFTDIVLGVSMSGTQLAERLQRDRPDLKVIYTSGYFAPDSLEAPLSPANFLAKPYHPHRLIEMARLACGRDLQVAQVQ